jgi:tight adherence protein C
MIFVATFIPTSLIAVAVLIIYSLNHNRSGFKLIEEGFAQVAEIAGKQKDRTNVKERLSELNNIQTYNNFRFNQFLISCSASLIPILLTIAGRLDNLSAIGLSLLSATICYFYLDRNLSKQIENRRLQMESEFPAIVEILTLAIGAGDSPISAFSRIANRSDSIFATSMRSVIAQVKSGVSFHKALDQFSQNSKSIIVRRFVDALVIAMMRGAPLVDVLQRHASEARVNHRNLILDKSGKAEITMMIPIVFLILPISVIFALWPSMSNLSFFAS